MEHQVLNSLKIIFWEKRPNNQWKDTSCWGINCKEGTSHWHQSGHVVESLLISRSRLFTQTLLDILLFYLYLKFIVIFVKCEKKKKTKQFNQHNTAVDAQLSAEQVQWSDPLWAKCSWCTKTWWSPSMQGNGPPLLYLQLQVLSESTGEIPSFSMFLICILFQHFTVH